MSDNNTIIEYMVIGYLSNLFNSMCNGPTEPIDTFSPSVDREFLATLITECDRTLRIASINTGMAMFCQQHSCYSIQQIKQCYIELMMPLQVVDISELDQIKTTQAFIDYCINAAADCKNGFFKRLSNTNTTIALALWDIDVNMAGIRLQPIIRQVFLDKEREL